MAGHRALPARKSDQMLEAPQSACMHSQPAKPIAFSPGIISRTKGPDATTGQEESSRWKKSACLGSHSTRHARSAPRRLLTVAVVTSAVPHPVEQSCPAQQCSVPAREPLARIEELSDLEIYRFPAPDSLSRARLACVEFTSISGSLPTQPAREPLPYADLAPQGPNAP